MFKRLNIEQSPQEKVKEVIKRFQEESYQIFDR